MIKFGPGIMLILGALAALGAAAIDMYLPSLPTIEIELAAGPGQAQFTLSAFFLGLGIGQLFYGPLSDSLGRRKVLIGGLLLYCIASLLCSFADTMIELIGVRFIQALGAASGGVIARAMVRDVFTVDKAAQAQSFINLAFSITPLLAPTIGGFLLIWIGWRSIFFALFIFGLTCLLTLYSKIPETLPIERRIGLSPRSILSGYKKILTNRRSLGSMLAGACAFSCMFTYFAASPFVYIQIFGIPDQYYGLLFGLNVLGIIGANFINARTVVKHGPLLMLRIGVGVLCIGGLLLFCTIFSKIGGIFGIIIPLFFVIGSIGFIGANAIALALEPFADLAGTTASLFGFIQMIMGAVSGIIVGALHDGTAGPMGLIILILSLASFIFLKLFVQNKN